MHGRKRTILVLATVGILVPGIILSFLFLPLALAGFITLISSPILFGVVLGGRSHRMENVNRLETRAAKRGDSAFFSDPRQP